MLNVLYRSKLLRPFPLKKVNSTLTKDVKKKLLLGLNDKVQSKSSRKISYLAPLWEEEF